LSPLQYAANAIGMAITGEEWSSNVVGNGGKPTGVLMYDKILTKEQREQLRDRFRDLREGPTDALMTLEAGMKYEQISTFPAGRATAGSQALSDRRHCPLFRRSIGHDQRHRRRHCVGVRHPADH
jgi:hypothetical protein